MQFHYFFGPDKMPFMLNEGCVVKSASCYPFHGIISRGLLNNMNKHKVGSKVWYKNAHQLEFAASEEELKNSDSLLLKEFTKECKVLSFGQSAHCAKSFIENYCNDLIISNDAYCEVWNIKEGHTSSVWKIDISDSQNSREYLFIINVGRDYEACIELEKTSRQMKDIAEHYPDINIAKVLDIQKIPLDYNGTLFEVIVTKNEWIENSHEINGVIDKTNEKEQYFSVERFMTKKENPSQISSVYGRRFSEKENLRIKRDIDSFLNCVSTHVATTIDINHGDAVWNGEQAIIIAIS
jgi:hypothetical protein